MADQSINPPGTFLTWLLARLSEGEKLTESKALNRAFVREVSRMRPNWYEDELFGPPHREFDLPILGLMHPLVRDFRLARRYKGKLVLTAATPQLAGAVRLH